ncbi:MAG: hypothetical protein H8D23_33300, partial [Candidatus Brocadiales bacterium]|nr:hypothetical protein [Candidatus Brocadiales bacterium]
WYSNIVWATGYLSPSPDGDKELFNVHPDLAPINWDKARAYYYYATTESSKDARGTYFAFTFKALGHVLHLLEDMAVPAHVRNDFTSHLSFNGFWDAIIERDLNKIVKQPYEYYVEKNPTIARAASAQIPTFSNIRLTDFWDTNQYDGSNPSTDPSLGLAEYTNANYFSDSTISNNNPTPEHDYPYPSINSNDYHICEDTVPNYPQYKRYYISRNDKTGCDHFALVSPTTPMMYFSDLTGNISSLTLFLDDNVHNTYANELIPKAIGYSAGLLNYFFRGTLEITPSDTNIYSIIDGSVTPQQFTKITAKVRNSTPDTIAGEEVQNCDIVQQNCILQAIAKYKIRSNYMDDLSNDPPTEADMQGVEFSYSVSGPIAISSLSSVTPEEFIFNFTNNPIPVGITDLYLNVIFKGTLGNEEDIAIAVGMVDMNEPQHFSIWNATDMFYLDGVSRTAEEIRTTPSLLVRVDFDSDGIVNETSIGEPYIDPYDVTTYIAFYPTSETPTLYNATYTPLPPERYGRIIILSDMPDFYLSVHRESTTPFENSDTNLLFTGITNQDNDGTFVNTQINTFRGIIQHQWSAYSQYYPDSTGISTAPWPVPAITDPYPTNSISQ